MKGLRDLESEDLIPGLPVFLIGKTGVILTLLLSLGVAKFFVNRRHCTNVRSYVIH